jgi:hypothetical protein
MAKATKTGGPSRIRFVMVEAELGDGDIGQITQAISNALRGPAPNTVVKRIVAPAPHVNGGADAGESEVVDETEAEAVDADDVTPAAPKAKTPRKPAPKPDVIQIDITSEPPLSSLIDPKSNHRR